MFKRLTIMGLALLSWVAAAALAAPVVSLTAPAVNSTYAAPASITLTANASSSGGTITKVEFYNGTNWIGTAVTAPYTIKWNNVAAAPSYVLKAKAYDSSGGTAYSAGVSVNVVSNQAPTVSLTSPAANSTHAALGSITLTASASDSDGTISRVEFYDGTTPITTLTAVPYTYQWNNVSSGTHTLKAVAVDNLGTQTTSALVTVTVGTNAAPTVNLTAPTNNTTLAAPAEVTLVAAAQDSDGTIAKVEFYRGTDWVGTKTTAPYTLKLTNIPAGAPYVFKAKAVDNGGRTTYSAGATVNVVNNQAPTVTLSANPTQLDTPGMVTLTASPNDADGTIAKVEFFDGTTPLGTSNAVPYTYIWTNAAKGSHSVTAKVMDNLGTVTTSSVVMVNVAVPQAQAYYIYADHLNTPRQVVDQSNKVVWQWDQNDPFGGNAPTANSGFVMNLRFPGQYYDKETNLHYNYYRDYDPQTGRYLQSDPIGLNGGMNTFAYVKANPLAHVDPFGLETIVVINNNTAIVGTHAGVFVGRGKDAILYDPGGSYRVVEKGSGDALPSNQADLANYIKYQLEDGKDVQIYKFDTTIEEETLIQQRIEEQGGGMPGTCAIRTSEAVNGIGPFMGLGKSRTPAGLGRSLADIQRKNQKKKR